MQKLIVILTAILTYVAFLIFLNGEIIEADKAECEALVTEVAEWNKDSIPEVQRAVPEWCYTLWRDHGRD